MSRNLWRTNGRLNFPLNGLELYLPLGHPELSGSPITAKVPLGGGITGAVTGATHTPPTHRVLDGDDFFDLSSGISTLVPSAGTLMMWMWSSSATVGVLFGAGKGGVDQQNYSQFVLAGANFTGDYADETLLYSIISGNVEKLRLVLRVGTGTYNDGVKRHIALRCDGVDNAIFVNGVKQSITFGVGNATTANWFLNPADAAEVFIGKRTYSGSPAYLTGKVGEFWLYSVGLSDLDIAHAYRSTKWRYV